MTELRVFYLKEKEQIDGFDPGDFDYIVVESEKIFPSIYAQLVEQGIAPGHIISRAYYAAAFADQGTSHLGNQIGGMTVYDYLIVGSGLFGSVFAYEMKKRGKRVLVLERRKHAGGNIYTESSAGIEVHKYGAHIFHTDQRAIWEYVQNLTSFRPFVNAPLANYQGRLYHLPFNMNTFYAMWGVRTPQEAEAMLARQKAAYSSLEPQNLEEQALKLVGRDIYEKLIKGYTEKQWGCSARELPAFIIQRIPVRMTFDNNYFNDRYQGIPEKGYTGLIKALLADIEVRLQTDFLTERTFWQEQAAKIVFTGRIDAYFDSCYGDLAWRSLRFEQETLDMENYQGVAVMNFTAADVPWTRIIEHKHFLGTRTEQTVISREYPQKWQAGDEPYYPVNDAANNALYEKYVQRAELCHSVIFGGRLGTYRYYNMDQIVEQALDAVMAESSY